MINRDELLNMAREAGLPTWFGVEPSAFIESFADAILERAAVECDNKANNYFELAMKSKDGADASLLGRSSGSHGCANAVRLLKKQGE